MTTYYCPDPIQSTQFIPGTNTPANGGQLFFYQGGTSTKVTVWKDNAAAVAWANPIVLDSGGNLPAGGEVWQQTAQPLKVVFAPSNDTDPPTSPYWTKDNLHGLNDPALLPAASEWLTTITPTFVSANQANYAGDVRATFTAGTRLKSLVTAGTSYGTITSVVFSAGSTAVGIDTALSIALDAGLSSTFIALLQGDNTESVPLLQGGRMLFMDSTDNTKMGGFDLSAIASSTNVTLPFSAIVTSAAQGASMVLLAATTVASSATVDFLSGINSSYDVHKIVFDSLVPTAGSTGIQLRASIDGGATYLSTSIYFTARSDLDSTSSTNAFFFAASSRIALQDVIAVTGIVGKYGYGEINCYLLAGNFNKGFDFSVSELGSGSLYQSRGNGFIATSNACNAIRLAFGTGFISTGTFYLYGIKKS